MVLVTQWMIEFTWYLFHLLLFQSTNLFPKERKRSLAIRVKVELALNSLDFIQLTEVIHVLTQSKMLLFRRRKNVVKTPNENMSSDELIWIPNSANADKSNQKSE